MAGAVYWVGQDNNVWLKGDNSVNGGATTNVGSATGANYNLVPGGFESNPLQQSIQATRIADPRPGGVTTTNSSNSTAPSYDPQQLALYDQQIGNVNAAINRIPTQQSVALGNAQNAYNTSLNQLLQTKAQGQQTYKTNTAQNQGNYVTAKNTIGSNAGNTLSGLLRLLGARGAGGSSAALFGAPTAVAQLATQQRAGAGQTYAGNQQSLDTNWNNYLLGERQNEKSLSDQLTNNNNSIRSQVDQTRANLLSNLATLQAQRTAYMGGNAAAAAQPYIDQSNQLLSAADSLGAQVPVYQVNPTTYTAPSLQSYTTNPFAAPQYGGQNNALTDSTTPFLSFLLGGAAQKDKNQQPVLGAQ